MVNLGTLTLSLIAQIGGFTAGLDAAERASKKSAEQIQKNIESIGVAGYAAGQALGQFLKQGIDTALNAFPALIEQAAKFQDIADKTGGSSEGFANFAVSAKVAGVSIEAIADASTKLSKNLNGLDDESKAAGAALKALNLPIDDFKKLRPDEQIKAVANALGGFADGAGKAAVAQQLFGKSGAELLKFFKDYTDNGGDVTILTADMIKQADDFADAQAKAKAQLSLMASALSTQAIPYITAFTSALTDTIKQIVGVSDSATDLKNNQAIAEFSESAVKALAFVIDSADGVARVFRVIGTSIGGAAAAASAAASGEFKDAKSIMKDIGDQVDNILLAPTFGANLKARIAEGKAAVASLKNDRATNAFYGITDQDGRPKLPESAVVHGGKGKVDHTAEQEAKAQLAADLDAIKNQQAAVQNLTANNEKILQAMRSAGLVDESDYYKQKRALLDSNTAAQETAEQQAIARLQQEKLSGKDAIDNAKKIADAQAKLTKIREDGATAVKVLGIEEQAAYNKVAAAILSARQAAQGYFDTTNKGYAAELVGVGQGSKNRERLAAIRQIEERYEQQRQDLQNTRAQAELSGTFTPQAQKQYQEQLAIINEFQGKALASYDDYYTKLDAAQKDWLNGAKEALSNYADEAGNVAKHTEEVFTNAFKGLEDQLTNLLTGKKFDAKALFESITSDLARNAVKEGITGPLASALKGLLGDSGGGIASLLGLGKSAGAASSAASMAALTTTTTGASAALAAFTAAATSAAAALGGTNGTSGIGSLAGLFGGGSAAATGGGDPLGAFIALNGFAGGGYTGSGAANDPAGLVHKGEVVWSQDDVARAGGVGNAESMRKGGGMVVTNNFTIQGSVSRETQAQIALAAGRSIDAARRKNG